MTHIEYTDPQEFAVISIPTREVFKFDHRHALFRDFDDVMVVAVRPLEQLRNGSWLVAVDGRVYEITERMMAEAVNWSEDSDLYRKLSTGDEGGDG